MNLEERLQSIKEFIEPWLGLLEVEVLKQYPRPLPINVQEWVEELQNVSMEELLNFINHKKSSIPNKGLQEFLSKVSKLTSFESASKGRYKLPQHLNRRVDLKKKHELEQIRSLCDELNAVKTIVDIGGGAGHLSSTLVDEKARFAYCLDRNEKFQKQGEDRLSKWTPNNFEKIKFVNCDFSENTTLTCLNTYEDNLVVGLHGCGELTTNTVKFFQNSGSSWLLSVGCCYQNLNGQYNISSYAKKSGVVFSKNALHLAARCHTLYSISDLEKKFSVRRFRYALHLYLHDVLGKTEFKSIGNTSLADYEVEFSDYAIKYADLGSDLKDELNKFFMSESTQVFTQQTIVADLIRELLGRVVECYIVTDRALYLAEHGNEVEVIEVFERQLSPRNLMVMATRNGS
ncbi:MAG: hypothetical protein CME64_07815 [Halobacteriovoraceae bacterium]|nr:hypothetical protein [Halobacteriovoraceae bacterium]|tara:strand:- start:104152 stop:105357 length:1206 start_codon:yes stop_codon:yes gene_type:complete